MRFCRGGGQEDRGGRFTTLHGNGGADVLLITDGEIWQAREMIAAARASGHRVFAIGVGTSPAEGVLRSLAEATGGACEFATPGEALEAAARRMLGRIRQQPWQHLRIDWGSKPVWQSALPAAVFSGDTVIAFAGVATRTQAAAVRMLATDTQGVTTELARGEADAPCPGDRLPRIAASHRMASADDTEALVLALDYQLMSKQTNCVLVHRRTDADKTTEQGELHRVSSMLAAGWGATSTVIAESADMDMVVMECSEPRAPSAWRHPRTAGTRIDVLYSLSSDEIEIPAFLRKQDAGHEPVSLQAIALAVAEHLEHGGQVQGLASHCESLELHADVRLALAQALDLGASEGLGLLLLAHWINVREHGLADPFVTETLLPHLRGLDAKMIDECIELFGRLLGGYANDHWQSSRAQRLQQAMTRATLLPISIRETLSP